MPFPGTKVHLCKLLVSIQDHKLAFESKDDTCWHGATASIPHSPGDHVWGVVWEIQTEEMTALDRYMHQF